MWEINITDAFADWYENLAEADQEPIRAAVEQLEQRGPSLGRPLVGQVDGSRLHNLKELRPLGKTIRILFVFDPRREAVLLLGADKAQYGWNAWYPGAITEAERLYDDYVTDLRKEGLIE